jgi:hypothetical protein
VNGEVISDALFIGATNVTATHSFAFAENKCPAVLFAALYWSLVLISLYPAGTSKRLGSICPDENPPIVVFDSMSTLAAAS